MHLINKTGIVALATLGVASLSACNDSDNNNNNAQLHEKFEKHAYTTITPKGKTAAERLVGTWILLGQGERERKESSMIGGKPRLDDSDSSSFAIREIIRISYDNHSGRYSFASCDGLGKRPLKIHNDSQAKTSYGPDSHPLQLDLSNDNEILANIDYSETYSDTRQSAYKLNARLYKLQPRDSFGNFSFQAHSKDPQWQQAINTTDKFNAECFVELQGQYTHRDFAFTSGDERHQQQGEIHSLGIEGPISTAKGQANLYVDFNLASDDKAFVKAQAASNIYSSSMHNNSANTSVWEVAYDDWQSGNAQSPQDIKWQFNTSESGTVNAAFEAAIGSQEPFSAAVNLHI